MPEKPTLDPNDIAAQTAAIAAHLQRSGVQWLPKANVAAAEKLTEQFVDGTDGGAQQNAALSAANDASSLPVAESVTERPVVSRQPTLPTREHAAVPITPIDQAYPGEKAPAGQRQSLLNTIDEDVQQCQRCEILSSCRKQTVFGEGSPSPRFVFFGEGPGADEDRSGRPFVGRAGQLLTKMIEACTLRREDVYIMNTVKCRPPGNRNPESEEIENCRDYYQRQLAILRPEYIVCLGAISSQELLQNKTSVGKMRGKLHRYYESKVVVTYHPAYLLRTPAAKKAAWDDLQLMMRDAGIAIP